MTPNEIFLRANLKIFIALGDLAMFVPATGASFEVHALPSSSLQPQPSGLSSETWSQQRTIELLLSEFTGMPPESGDVIEVNGGRFRLEVPVENDGQIIKFTVVEL
jgi:hypothetical protein